MDPHLTDSRASLNSHNNARKRNVVLMYCVECRLPVPQLYFQYKLAYIKLTTCSGCGKIADKYVEYDKVLIFIDVLLLKQGAYLHLANMLEEDITKNEKLSYSRLARLYVMALLFEVYLAWALAERSLMPDPKLQVVLTYSMWWQYGYFVLILIARHLVQLSGLLVLLQTSGVDHVRFNPALSPNLQRQYFVSVVVTAVLISTCLRLLPILMLIWPYDTRAVPVNIVKFIGVANMAELLRLLTNAPTLIIGGVLLTTSAAQEVIQLLIDSNI